MIEACRAVSQRAAQTLKIAERNRWLLDIALDHRTLGRAVLYEFIFWGGRGSTRAQTSGADGKDGAGVEAGPPDTAERGPMPLFQADIHLHRARLFGTRNGERGAGNEKTEYPWESVETDLAEAERLIGKHGYHRRDEELADAKQALLGH